MTDGAVPVLGFDSSLSGVATSSHHIAPGSHHGSGRFALEIIHDAC